jgi:hypothetical protein
VAARSKAWGCGHSIAGIAGSSSAGGMDVCLLWVLRVFGSRSLQRADPSSRGVLPNMCLCVCVSAIRWNSNPLHLQWLGRKRSKLGRKEGRKEGGKKERKKERKFLLIKFMSHNVKANSKNVNGIQIRTSEVSTVDSTTLHTPHASSPSLLSLQLVCVNFLPRAQRCKFLFVWCVTTTEWD